MQDRDGSSFWLNIAIAVVGAILTVLVSKDVWTHALELARFFQSGNWEVTTNELAIQKSLRSEYPDSRKWIVQFAGGNSSTFPLAAELREETFNEIGQSVTDEGEILGLRRGILPGVYGDLLSDALLSLGQSTTKKPSAKDTAQLQRLSALLRSDASQIERPSKELYNRSVDVLARLPNTAPLRKALAAYRSYDFTVRDFHAFEVFSAPPYDNDDLWTANTRTVTDKTDRCQGEATALTAGGSPIKTYVERYPRVVKIDLTRDWLSEALLDNMARHGNPISDKYFGSQGRLKLIPTSLWIMMEDEIRLIPTSEGDARAISALAMPGECCIVTCAPTTVTLEPTSVKPVPGHKDEWFGLASGTTPVVFAIVSTRRNAD